MRRAGGQILTLHDAAKLGDVAALKSMLEGGIDVNAEDGRGVTALGVAVGFNRLPAVKALLEAGADVHKRDLKGNTVLFYAAGKFTGLLQCVSYAFSINPMIMFSCNTFCCISYVSVNRIISQVRVQQILIEHCDRPLERRS